MSDNAPDGWATSSVHGNSEVYHTDPECRCFPEEHARRLGPNEIVSRELTECAVCAGEADDLNHGGRRSRECPFCGEPVRLRNHLPCPDGGDADE